MIVDIVLMIVTMSLIGAAMGTFSGMVPGIHVNTLATMMLAAYGPMECVLEPFIPTGYVPIAVCCCIVSAAIVHSSVDYVPSVFTGAPDPDDVVSMLPGHRLLNDGRGMVAVRSAAIGSCVGSCVSIVLAIPLQFLLMNGLGDYLDSITAFVLCAVVMILVMNEKGIKRMFMSIIILLISGCLGLACMDLDIPCNGIMDNGTLLFPMLSGLFGMPAMLESLKKSEVVEQYDDDEFPVSPIPGIKGVLMGSLTGWFPGITSTTGSIIGTMFSSVKRAEDFISMTASIGSASAIMMLTTLSVSGKGRSGAMMVVEDILGDDVIGILNERFLILLTTAAIATFIAYRVTIRCGMVMCDVVSRFDISKVNRLCLILIIVLVASFTGPYGIFILIVSTMIGFIPIRFDIGRVYLTGCLLIPTILTFLYAREFVLMSLL